VPAASSKSPRFSKARARSYAIAAFPNPSRPGCGVCVLAFLPALRFGGPASPRRSPGLLAKWLTIVPATSAMGDQHGRDEHPLVGAGKLAEPIQRRRRARLHRVVVQIALHISREGRWPSRSGGCGLSSRVFITIQSSSPLTSFVSLGRLHVALGRDRRQRQARIAQPGARLGGSSP